jgi:hypothetical protein
VDGDVQGLTGYVAGLREVVLGFPDYRWELRLLLFDGDWIGAHFVDTGPTAERPSAFPPPAVPASRSRSSRRSPRSPTTRRRFRIHRRPVLWKEAIGLSGAKRTAFLNTVSRPRLEKLIGASAGRARSWTDAAAA